MPFIAGIVLTAAMAVSTPTPSFGLSVYPAAVSAPSGLSSASFTLADTGHTPLTIVMEAGILQPIQGHPKNWAIAGTYQGVKFSASKVVLQPGQSKKINVTLDVKDHFRHDFAISAIAEVGQGTGTATVSTSVSARYTVNPSGKQQPGSVHPIAQAAPITLGGNDDVVILPALGGLALLTLFGGGLIYHRRHRGTRRGAHARV